MREGMHASDTRLLHANHQNGRASVLHCFKDNSRVYRYITVILLCICYFIANSKIVERIYHCTRVIYLLLGYIIKINDCRSLALYQWAGTVCSYNVSTHWTRGFVQTAFHPLMGHARQLYRAKFKARLVFIAMFVLCSVTRFSCQVDYLNVATLLNT